MKAPKKLTTLFNQSLVSLTLLSLLDPIEHKADTIRKLATKQRSKYYVNRPKRGEMLTVLGC